MPTQKLGLPTIAGNETNDVVRDFLALINKLEALAGTPGGLAILGADGKLEPGQENAQNPKDATTLVKGIVMLSNLFNGDSELKAVTEKALSEGLKTVLKLSGGKMTGNLTIENNAPILELSETDTGEKYFLVLDGSSFSIRKSNTGNPDYAFKLDEGKAFVFSSRVLTEIMKNVPGGYAGLDSKGKIQDAQLSDSVVFDMKYLKVRHSYF